ncbi:hypothetical protein DPMN_035479 [Dreissena polymorpha]|uniref:Uncharacterized protein n=1 Tax=Dreissena polymorpha TaxID=45954 RepID=A0A9D4RL17_DREPO|nr:hypothetical protein DPMN_035479 [Dreissena polymorpha]
MQRTCHPLFIVESSPARTCQRSRLKRAGDGRDSKTTSVGDIRDGPGSCASAPGGTQEHQGGGFKEGPRGGGT